jgi:thiol-disulfide isomerase/thioredoxin
MTTAPAPKAAQVPDGRLERRATGRLAAVLLPVLLSLTLTAGTASASTPGGPGIFPLAPGSVALVENIPAATLLHAATAQPRVAQAPTPLPPGTSALTSNGKPEILYVGANYCPFCAAERWVIVMALSKFGTFRGLEGTSSSASDINASTPTFTFYGSSYKSRYLSFVAVETKGNIAGSSGQYPTLQTLAAGQLALIRKWDAPPYVPSEYAGAVPFLYMAGRYIVIGSQFDASPIAGWTFTAAASYVTSGSNPTSKGVEAAAGQLTASLCVLTHNRPASVCKGTK